MIAKFGFDYDCDHNNHCDEYMVDDTFIITNALNGHKRFKEFV